MYFSTLSLMVNSNPLFQLDVIKRKKLSLHINVFDQTNQLIILYVKR